MQGNNTRGKTSEAKAKHQHNQAIKDDIVGGDVWPKVITLLSIAISSSTAKEGWKMPFIYWRFEVLRPASYKNQ